MVAESVSACAIWAHWPCTSASAKSAINRSCPRNPQDIRRIQLRAIPLDGLLQFPFKARLLSRPYIFQLPYPRLELPLHFAVCRHIGSEPRLRLLPPRLHVRDVLRELPLHLEDLR